MGGRNRKEHMFSSFVLLHNKVGVQSEGWIISLEQDANDLLVQIPALRLRTAMDPTRTKLSMSHGSTATNAVDGNTTGKRRDLSVSQFST